MNAHEETEFSFNGTCPMPKTLRITAGTHLSFMEKIKRYINIKLYGHDNWYNWSIANWGTKWDACEPHINHDDKDYFSVNFESAWAPPVLWIRGIMKDFPDLSFTLEYEEPGMCFGGRLTAQHGEIWDDHTWDIDQASECCEGKVYYTDDEEFTLPQISDEKLSTWVGKDKMWKTIKDIPAYHIFPDYQCGVCGEECETIDMNTADIKPAKIKVNGTNEN